MSEEKKSSKWLYILFLVLGLGIAASVFLVFFDSIGEEDMISYSYLMVFFTIAGIAGLATKNSERALKNSLIWGFSSLFLLFIFYVQVFPSL